MKRDVVMGIPILLAGGRRTCLIGAPRSDFASLPRAAIGASRRYNRRPFSRKLEQRANTRHFSNVLRSFTVMSILYHVCKRSTTFAKNSRGEVRDA